MARMIKDDVDRFHDYSIHVPSRTIFMGTENLSENDFEESGVDTSMAERQIKNLHLLDSISKEEITILMNNIGGDPIHGMAIYDAIKACQSHITIKVFGHAMSMGSVILQAADERIMAPNSRFMFHYGTFAINKESKSAYNWADENKKYDHWMENLFLMKIQQKHPAFTLKKLQKMLDFDTILTPEETIALGLADRILLPPEHS
jgi:ATP-dependent protease ClpP protease subunit